MAKDSKYSMQIFAITGETGELMAAPVIVYRIFLKQKMQLVIVISRGLMDFSVGIL